MTDDYVNESDTFRHKVREWDLRIRNQELRSFCPSTTFIFTLYSLLIYLRVCLSVAYVRQPTNEQTNEHPLGVSAAVVAIVKASSLTIINQIIQ